MLLTDFLTSYTRTRDLRSGTVTHYQWVIASFVRLHGDVDLADLTVDLLATWLRSLGDTGRSPWTIRQRRISLLVLWRAAWLAGLAPPIPPLQRLRRLQTVPQAWTIPELWLLIQAAEDDTARPLYWESLIRAAYDTGLRLGDLLDLRVGQVRCDVIQLVQGKTGRVVACRLRPQTLAIVDRQTTGHQAGSPVWPLWGRREAFYRAFRRLVDQAGIRPGTFRWIRRTAVTQLERVAPGQGTRLAGHAHRATTESWYIDRGQLDPAPLPPLERCR